MLCAYLEVNRNEKYASAIDMSSNNEMYRAHMSYKSSKDAVHLMAVMLKCSVMNIAWRCQAVEMLFVCSWWETAHNVRNWIYGEDSFRSFK